MLSFDKLQDLQIVVEAREEGREQGLKEGQSKTKNLLIKLINKKFKKIPDDLKKTIKNSNNLKVIEKILESIFDIQNIEEIYKLLDKK